MPLNCTLTDGVNGKFHITLCCCSVTKWFSPALLQPHILEPAVSVCLCVAYCRLLCPQDFPGKNSGVGPHFLLQRIFPTQGSNSCLLLWQAGSLPLSHLGGPCIRYCNLKNKFIKKYIVRILLSKWQCEELYRPIS